MSQNYSELVRKYLNHHPSVLDCLRLGVLNLSAVAREIAAEGKTENVSAIIKALQRIEEKIKPHSIKHERTVLKLLKDSKVRVHTEAALLLCSLPPSFDFLMPLYNLAKKERSDIQIIEGEEVLVIITHEDFVDDAKKILKGHVKEVQDELVQIRMIFDEKFQDTPGVIALVLEKLYQGGINVREVVSAWTDLILIISERDLLKTLEILHLDS